MTWLSDPMTSVGASRSYLAVVGPSQAPGRLVDLAHEVGAAVADAGSVLVSGGLGGVMEAACRGARSGGGLTVGLLPGNDRSAANQWLDVAIPTGLGEARNALVVRAADAVIAVGGEYGTLSEIALALKAGKPVVGLATWQLVRGDGRPDHGIVVADTAADAVVEALHLASGDVD